MIKIRVIAEANIESELIRYWTWNQFSHVEFWHPQGWLGSRLNGGVQFRPFDYIKPTLEKFLTVQLAPNAEAAIWSWAERQIGESYGWRDVVDQAVHEDILAPKGMDCSHFVSKALFQGGFLVSRKPFYQNTPADIYNCTSLVEVA